MNSVSVRTLNKWQGGGGIAHQYKPEAHAQKVQGHEFNKWQGMARSMFHNQFVRQS